MHLGDFLKNCTRPVVRQRARVRELILSSRAFSGPVRYRNGGAAGDAVFAYRRVECAGLSIGLRDMIQFVFWNLVRLAVRATRPLPGASNFVVFMVQASPGKYRKHRGL